MRPSLVATLTALLLACGFVPTAVADCPPHCGPGGPVYPLTVVSTEVRSADSIGIDLGNDGDPLPAGTMLLVSGRSLGPGTVQGTLVLDGADGTVRTSMTWTWPGDGLTRVVGGLVPETGDYSILLETASSTWTPVSLFLDHTAYDVAGKVIPAWRPELEDGTNRELQRGQVPEGAAVFPFTATADGRQRLRVTDSTAYLFDVTVARPSSSAAQWPNGFSTLGSSDARGRLDGPATTHSVIWDAAAGETVLVIVRAAQTVFPPDRDPVDGNFNPWLVVPRFDVPPQEAANPAWLALAAIVGSALLARRSREG